MQNMNILLICGGGGSEHDISLQSAKYILSKLVLIPNITPYYLCIQPNGDRTNLENQKCELRKAGEIYNQETNKVIKLDYAIPCIHGPPGENGQIQSIFELMGLRYLGASPESSLNCFNKITTKLWLSSANILNTPSIYLEDSSPQSLKRATVFMQQHDLNIFVKAASQGSSIGCYKCTDVSKLESLIKDAFEYSQYVLIEKALEGRELEVAVFSHADKTIATTPGEIVCPTNFYSFEEKYLGESTTRIEIEAKSIKPDICEEIKNIALKCFKTLKIKDLARVDFFLTNDDQIFVNEINTFPGHTSISMFPQMLENTGLKYEHYLENKIFNK